MLIPRTWLLFIPVAAFACRVDQTVIEPPPAPTQPDVFSGAAVQAATPPPPISGATVRLVKAGSAAYAVVSDPDEDAVHIVSAGTTPKLVGTVALQRGDEPNRIVADSQGRAHVVLRSGGAIATIDVASATLVTRRNVCPAPRGIDYDVTNDMLYVACATGELVSLPSVGPVARTVHVDVDLRDVVVDNGQVYVSRFKSAELLTLAADGTITARSKQPVAVSISSSMESVVAWRTVHAPGGGATMLHQLASNEALVVKPWNTYYADSSGPIVVSSVSSASSSQPTTTALSINPAIDVTFDASGSTEALSVDGEVELSTGVVVTLGGTAFSNPTNTEFTGIDDGRAQNIPWIVVQERAPTPELRFYQGLDASTQAPWTEVALPSKVSHLDTGFDIFHLPTLVGTACMSCHPEGDDDGHAWKFAFKDATTGVITETRLRRTQSLLGGVVTGTAPYHWDGDLADMQSLMDEVFTHRMGGGHVNAKQAPILMRWLNAIPNPPTRNDLDAARVANGLALFNGTGGCVKCHNGPRGTLVDSQDIGKTDVLGSTKPMQVPMLLGVGNRAPYMHDGCAKDLMERLTNPSCAGSKHGNTSLGASDLQDLVTYLESL